MNENHVFYILSLIISCQSTCFLFGKHSLNFVTETLYLKCKYFNSENTFFFIDINECLSIPCDKNAHCINNNGSYSCSCKAGFKENGTVCVGMYALTCLLLSLNLILVGIFCTLHLLTFVLVSRFNLCCVLDLKLLFWTNLIIHAIKIQFNVVIYFNISEMKQLFMFT